VVRAAGDPARPCWPHGRLGQHPAPPLRRPFATGSSWQAFRVGIAASGLVSGTKTNLGGLGHTLPYLFPEFRLATAIAIVVVLAELWVIAWVRARYMDTSFLRAAFQVVLGGFLVFVTGILIGRA
jgi:VIT1/CCC1 family predicted Fe2+/Mn2+ transporter